MGENRKKLLRRRSIVENLIEKPPFHYEKNYPPSSEIGSLDSEETDKIINISLSGNQHNLRSANNSKIQLPKQACQTTINLYINDPHMVEKNWEKYRKIPPRRKMRNEIVLGKNIPDHALMKNLLDDLGVKKYSSAPNMTNKNLRNKKSLNFQRYSSEKLFPDCAEAFPKVESSGRSPSNDYSDKGTRFLYVNDGRSGGDFKKENIGMINEEDEEVEAVKEVNNECPVHFRDHSVVRVTQDCKVMEDDKPKVDLIDPLKRFRRRPFRLPQVSKNAAILYRDIAASETSPNKKQEKLEQPKRRMPAFNLRTQMVRDILNTNPELMHSYQSGLMRSHKKLFDSLRQKDFQNVSDEHSCFESNVQQLPVLKNTEQHIDEINRAQSKLILCGQNRRPICSVETHGSYEDYKRNLVKGPDGKMCCNNILSRDEDIWSKAETRNFITTEFVKDKIKKFDQLFSRKKSPECQKDNVIATKKKNFSRRRSNIDYFHFQGTLSHNLLNEENVSFPKETKNAMTRLLSKKSQMPLEHQDSEKKMFRTLKEIRDLSVEGRDSTESSSSCEDSMRSNGSYNSHNRCWPGVAERVRSTAEGNKT